MAKASWLVVEPSSGSGNGSVAVSSASGHTGRSARETEVTFSAANCEDVVRKVIQAGKAEFTQFDSATAAVDKSGGTVTLTGVTNSSKLTFSLGSGDLELTLPSSYTANSASTDNGAEIAGDPGTDAEFPFSITLEVPANETIAEESVQVIVTDAAGNQSICTITEASGDAYLTVEEGDIYLDCDGTAVSVTVESNTSWTVS